MLFPQSFIISLLFSFYQCQPQSNSYNPNVTNNQQYNLVETSQYQGNSPISAASTTSGADLTASQLSQIINPCGVANQNAPGENIQCPDALSYINEAFTKFNIQSPEAKAMYLSTMNIESGGLTYSRNHFPGRPGQGTYSMMMPNNLFQFVKSNLDSFAGTNLPGLANGNYDDNDNARKGAILDVLVDKKYAFWPGAWWITQGAKIANGCSIDMNASPTQAEATTFISSCIGVATDSNRIDSYTKALSVLKQ